MIQTVRDIEAGEEITINYNGDWNDPKPVWFEVIDE
jgi:SET domain-containing protein